jgi:hypothetical protein
MLKKIRWTSLVILALTGAKSGCLRAEHDWHDRWNRDGPATRSRGGCRGDAHEHADRPREDGRHESNGPVRARLHPCRPLLSAVTAPGFGVEVRNDIEISAAQGVQIDFMLHVQSANQSVIVTSETLVVSLGTSDQRGQVTSTQLNELPVAHQDWTTLLQSTPGVAQTNNGSAGSEAGSGIVINGLPATGYNLTVTAVSTVQSTARIGRVVKSSSSKVLSRIKAKPYPSLTRAGISDGWDALPDDGYDRGASPSELFALRWRSFDNVDTLSITETVYKGKIRPYGKTDGSLTDVHLPAGLAEELCLWKQENAKLSPSKVVPTAFIFPNTRGCFMDTGNYRHRVLNPLAEKLSLPKLNFQVMCRTMAPQAQGMGSVKDI